MTVLLELLLHINRKFTIFCCKVSFFNGSSLSISRFSESMKIPKGKSESVNRRTDNANRLMYAADLYVSVASFISSSIG